MDTRPTNASVALGFRLFLYFAAFIVVGVFVTLATVDMRFGPLPLWAQAGTVVLQAVLVLLPLASFYFSLMGLVRIDKQRERGAAKSVFVMTSLLLFAALVVFLYTI